MKNKWLYLLLLSVPVIQLHAQPRSTKPSLLDLPNEVKIGIFTKVIAKSRRNIPPLLQVHSTFPALLHTSFTEIPYIAEILAHKNHWILPIADTALANQEPTHLSKLLEFEASLLNTLLTDKEQALVSSIDWKKHALATLLATSATHEALREIAVEAAMDATKTVSKEVTDDHSNYRETWQIAQDSVTTTYLTARMDAACRAAKAAARSAARCPARTAIQYRTYSAARFDDYSATYNAAYNLATTTLKEAITEAVVAAAAGQQDGDKMGKIAYRAAETITWIKILDPEQKTFAKAYEVAYQRLFESELSPNTTQWFNSTEKLEDKISQYFGKSSLLGQGRGTEVSAEEYAHRYTWVKPLIEHLKRIAAKAWELEAQGL
ncbi:MAG: hypothetical protein OXT67_09080 [Zetaproteobacteria bacterium]|nr:hypothetical protein [Zetaproteobacteria bacterium]